MSTKPQYIVPHYYTYGPRPFSGYALPYYDNYVIEAMVGIRAWQVALGWQYPTVFSVYSLTKADGESQYTFRRGPITNYTYSSLGYDSALVDALLWDARNLDDLRTAEDAAIALPHVRRVLYSFHTWIISFVEWLQGALTGHGKTIVGNYYWDLQAAVQAILSEQGATVQYWCETYKEMPGGLIGEPTQFGGEQDQLYIGMGIAAGHGEGAVAPGHKSYNLTTDHIELMRVWPRSTVLVCDILGAIGIMDAWCQDLDSALIPYSAGHKACRYGLRSRVGDGTALGMSLATAVIEAGPPAGFFMLGDGKIIVNRMNGYAECPLTAWPTAAPRDMATRDQIVFHVVHEDGVFTTVELEGAEWRDQGATGLYFSPGHAEEQDGEWLPPDYTALTTAQPTGLDILARENCSWSQPSTNDMHRYITGVSATQQCLVMADKSQPRLLLLAYHAGYRGETSPAWQDFYRVVGEVPLSFYPSGVCMETTDGTPKGGPPTRWRMLVGEHSALPSQCRIRPVDVYCDYPMEVAANEISNMVEEADDDGWRYVTVSGFEAPYHVQDQGEWRCVDVAPMPGFTIRFQVPASLASYDVGFREIARAANGTLGLHALCSLGGYMEYPTGNLQSRGAGTTNQLAHARWAWPTNAQLNACSLGITYALVDGEPTFTVPATDAWVMVDFFTLPLTQIIDWSEAQDTPVELALGNGAESGALWWLSSSLDWTADGSGEPRFMIAAFYGLNGIYANDWTVMYADGTQVGCYIPRAATSWPQWYAWVPGGSWWVDDGVGYFCDANLSNYQRHQLISAGQQPLIRDAYGLDVVRYLGGDTYVGYATTDDRGYRRHMAFTFRALSPDEYKTRMSWSAIATDTTKMWDYRTMRHTGVLL